MRTRGSTTAYRISEIRLPNRVSTAKKTQVEHGERNIAAHHGLVGNVADTRDGVQRLGDQCTGEQAGQGAADDGDQGDQGVAEGMVIDDLALGQTLGPGRADKVGVEHLQHVGAGIAHQGADADDHQGDDGQNQMMSHVQELPREARNCS